MWLSQTRRVSFAIVGVCALFVGATLLTAAALIWSGRQAALERAQEQVRQFGSGAETGLNRSLLGVDVLLATVDDLLQLSSQVAERMDPEHASRLMRSGVEQNLLVRYVALLTAKGEVVASSDLSGQQLEVVLPEGFLKQLLVQPVYTVLISAPVRDAQSAEWVMYFGRTSSLADGTRMATVAQVQVPLVGTLLAQGGGNGAMEMTLERSDGQLLVSVPAMEALWGSTLPASLNEVVASGAVVQDHSRLNGAAALLTVRRTLYRSVWITVAYPLDAVLAPWRVERNTIAAAAALVILMIIAAGGFARWYLNRMERTQEHLAQSKAVLDQALNAMDSGFLLLDPQGRIITWNRRYEDMFPGMRGQLVPLMPYHQAFEVAARSFLPEASDHERQAWIQQRLAYSRAAPGEHDQQYPDGRVVRISIRETPDGGHVCVLRDVSEERKAQADLRIAATAFESQEGILVTDAQRSILRVNRAFTDMTGYSAEEVLGRNPRLLSSGHHDAQFYQAMWKSINSTGHWQGEILDRRKTGEAFHEHLTITAVKDEHGSVTHYVATMLDITQRKAAAEEIERLAFYDPLTGLPNRRLLMDRLQQALVSSARTSRHGALLFLDLDHFKVLNDTLGHDRGDVLLNQVAQRLGHAVREVDTVARLGGDEFVVLLEDLSEQAIDAADQTQHVGDKILAALNLPYPITTHHYHSTCSIGAVLFCGQTQTVDELLKQADLAMYDAKTAGRNGLRFFDPQMQASMTERAALEKDLRVALACGQFELYYQKQVTHVGQVVGAEVLIRWHHPERGVVSPLEFIALAEETGLIMPIGHWVLHTACAQLTHWAQDPTHSALQLAVNVSARQFRQGDFVELVRAVLLDTGAPPQRLKLELTESLVLDDVDDTIAKMNALRALGVRFAMDDFGTGQSSLSYLTQLPLDQLKIDQSFVRNIGVTPADALIVQTIIGMASNLGLEVIAEGVETQEQRDFLEHHGCGLCQGYLFGKPVPLTEFDASLPSSIRA